MKKITISILAAFVLLAVGQTALAFELKLEDTTIAGSGIVSVTVKGAQNLGAADLKATYDNKILKLEGIDLGSVSKNGMVEFKDDNGTVSISFVDPDGISKDGQLLALKFSGIGEGVSDSTLTASAYGTDLKDMQVEAEGGKITVGGSSLITWIVIGGVILAGILFFFMKKKKGGPEAKA
ncbi:MAG: cohesin domain-containing protein [Candidatus Paceibacterota bacterium]|jgi:hypothetical protein